MFVLNADKAQLTVQQLEPVTSGSVNVYQASFTFSEDWNGLDRTAVFRAGTKSRSVFLAEDGQAVIPWEVLEQPNVHLFAGVYGTQGGHTVLPTVWADLGTILAGVKPREQAQPPTPDLWKQELAQKGGSLTYDGLNLSLMSGESELSTVQIAGGGGGKGKPGKDGVSPTVSTEPVEGGTKVTITDVDGNHFFTVYDGKDGTGGGVSFTIDDTLMLSKENVLGVAVPVRDIISQEDFDALQEDEKKNGLYVIPGTGGGSSGGGSSEEIYSTEEMRIGTWIDGKPFYRIAGKATLPDKTNTWVVIHPPIPDISEIISIRGSINNSGWMTTLPPTASADGTSPVTIAYYSFGFGVNMLKGELCNKPFNYILEYTKTTDKSAIQFPTVSSATSATIV